MKNKLLFLFLLFSGFFLNAQIKDFWSESTTLETASKKVLIKNLPKKYKSFDIDLGVLKTSLSKYKKPDGGLFEIDFPGENANPVTYIVKETAVMHPDLAAKYPAIKTFKGYRKDKPSQKVRFSINEGGVHAMFTDNQRKVAYLDPYAAGSKKYIRYARKDLSFEKFDLICNYKPEAEQKNQQQKQFKKEADDLKLRTYRLAMACTGEYAQYHIEKAGYQDKTDAEKKAKVLEEIVVLVNRVNEVYENDLAISLQLLGNTDNLIFLDPDNDPYTNDDGSAMLSQNQTTCDNIIGTANYDIGHVLSTGGGGVAILASTCSPSSKARGVTGSSDPIGDLFYIDFVAHEFGHQFGAEHTFNGDSGNCGNGNRNEATAVEPGSGTTLMAYAGLCSPQNVQMHSDFYFHKVSISEIWNNITAGNSSCGNESNLTQNLNVPAVNAGTDFTIPASTPFKLHGEGSDADNDPITYCWEQIDAGVTDVPPEPTTTNGAVYRSWSPDTSPDRYFPSMLTLLSGATSSTWEMTPSVTRDLNFVLTVRDNNPEAGQVATDQMKVSIDGGAGPFEVTSQNTTGLKWMPNTTETITWNVANTAGGTIGASHVNIYLSTDNGLTFDTLLKGNTPNDGSETITVPSETASKCYVMVEAAGNIFFSINKTSFSIGDFNEVCTELVVSDDTPLTIPDNNIDGVTSKIVIQDNFTIEHVSVEVKISHTWVADLWLVLISPAGKEIELLSGACGEGDDVDVVFDDLGAELVCGSAPSISGTITPTGSFRTLNGDSSAGEWKLKVVDNGQQDVGTLESWSIKICSSEEALGVPVEKLENFTLYPNPAKGAVNISFKASEAGDARFEIYDLLGRKLSAGKINRVSGNFKTRLNLNGFNPGVYLIRVFQGEKMSVAKIIVK